MKYTYWFEQMNFINSSPLLVMRFSQELIPVQIFINSDCQGGKREYIYALDYIEKVLNGQSECEIFTGNACYVEVKKDMTKIEYMFTNNDSEESCEIETIELKELINIWLKEQQTFYSM